MQTYDEDRFQSIRIYPSITTSFHASEGEADFLIISGEGDFVCGSKSSFYRKQLDFSAWHVIIYLSLNAPCSGM